MSETEGKLSPYMEAWTNHNDPCTKCGSNMVTDHHTCLKCGTGQKLDVQEDMPMTEEIKKPEVIPDKIPYACAICGVIEYKTLKAKRVLCKKHEDQRINAGRRTGIVRVKGVKEYTCSICGKKIKIAEKHWCNRSRHGYDDRWHSHCNAKRQDQLKSKFTVQSILTPV